jgi:hypothetical protein
MTVAFGRQLSVRWRITMWDLIFVALTIGLFALSIAYTRGCEKI